MYAGSPSFNDDKRDVLINPSVIIEVLSPSTEDYDRGRKFVQYQHITALTDYLLVAQDTPRVDHFSRQSESHWLLTTAIGLDAQVAIASISCVLYLSEVYDRISFE